ncbi:UbiX family flavin prenyltransferase [Pelotomaculum sp. FP]|uniref:UbiX family flavin prenyltransferase n=1 Tax=Pelotomaculum sp. FP TaxID=261474 RepID=UPI0032B81E49
MMLAVDAVYGKAAWSTATGSRGAAGPAKQPDKDHCNGRFPLILLLWTGGVPSPLLSATKYIFSGAIYGITILKYLNLCQIEGRLILSRWSRHTIITETDYTPEQVMDFAHCCYEEDDMAAAVSSGSFKHHVKTLAAVASGYSDKLIARAADVTIKENRKLVLMPRETPLSPIHLENMLKLARIGVVIMPPLPAHYNRPETIQKIVNHSAGRALEQLGIENKLFHSWGSE